MSELPDKEDTAALASVKQPVRGYAKNRVATSLGLPTNNSSIGINKIDATPIEEGQLDAQEQLKTGDSDNDGNNSDSNIPVTNFGKSSLLSFARNGKVSPNSKYVESVPSSPEIGSKPVDREVVEMAQAPSQTDEVDIPDEDNDAPIQRSRVARPQILDEDEGEDDMESGSVRNSINNHEGDSPTPSTRKKPAISNLNPEDIVNDAMYPGQNHSKPKKTTKITKKEMEETEKETERIARGLELAPEVKSKGKFTVSGFLEKFEKPKKSVEQSNNSNSQEPSSDITDSPGKSPQAEKEVTPTTSPMENNDDVRNKNEENLFDNIDDDPFTSPIREKEDNDKIINHPSSSPFRGPEKKPEIKVTPRKLIRFLDHKKCHGNNNNPVSSNDNDDDSDLEIEMTPNVGKVHALKQLNNIKVGNPGRMKYQKMFNQKSNQSANKSLMAILEAKQREQILRDREEKKAALEARGGKVMTEEERNKEHDTVEYLLERERKKADQLRQQENDDENEEEDEDYDPDRQQDGEEEEERYEQFAGPVDEEELEEWNNQVADEDEEGEHEQEGDEQERDDDEELEDSNEELEQENNVSRVYEEEDDTLPSLHKWKTTRKIVELDDEDEEDGGSALVAHGESTVRDMTAYEEEEEEEASMSQLFQQTQDPNDDSTLSPKSKMDLLREQNNNLSHLNDDNSNNEDNYPPNGTQQEIHELKEKYQREHDPTEPNMTQLSQLSVVSEEDSSNRETLLDSFVEKKQKPKYDRSTSAAKAIVDEEAVESDDEWAGVGGASDDEDADEDGFLKELVDDNTKERSNEAAVRKLFAENERVADNKLVNQLMEDVTYGGWRKRKGGGDLDGLSDDDHDEAYYIEERRRREERKRQKLLEDEQISSLASNPKAQAFLNSIADHTTSIKSEIIEDNDNDEKDGGTEHAAPARKKLTVAAIRQQLSFLDDDDNDNDSNTVVHTKSLPVENEREYNEEGNMLVEEQESDDDLDILNAAQKRRSTAVDRMSEKKTFLKSKIDSQDNDENDDEPIYINQIKRVSNMKTEKIVKDVEVLRSLSVPNRKNKKPVQSSKPKQLQPGNRNTNSAERKKRVLARASVSSANVFKKGEWDS